MSLGNVSQTHYAQSKTRSQPGAAIAPESQHRVTAMFADSVGSTSGRYLSFRSKGASRGLQQVIAISRNQQGDPEDAQSRQKVDRQMAWVRLAKCFRCVISMHLHLKMLDSG